MKQQGSIIIFALILLLFLLNISWGLLDIFLPKLKTLQEASYSVRALYAADTAAELCLYEARIQPGSPIGRNNPVPTNPPYKTILTNGAIFKITNLAGPVDVTDDCRPLGANTFQFRTTGQYKGTVRSIEVSQ
jgi:hypothetical protein